MNQHQNSGYGRARARIQYGRINITRHCGTIIEPQPPPPLQGWEHCALPPPPPLFTPGMVVAPYPAHHPGGCHQGCCPPPHIQIDQGGQGYEPSYKCDDGNDHSSPDGKRLEDAIASNDQSVEALWGAYDGLGRSRWRPSRRKILKWIWRGIGIGAILLFLYVLYKAAKSGIVRCILAARDADFSWVEFGSALKPQVKIYIETLKGMGIDIDKQMNVLARSFGKF